MALKNKIKNKLALGLVVDRFRHLSVKKGQYLFWLGDSLTPLIGEQSSTTWTVSGGMFVAPSTAAASFIFTQASAVDFAVDSFIMALRAKQTANTSPTLKLTNAGGSDFISAVSRLGDTAKHSILSNNANYIESGANTFPADGGAERSIVLAYDASANELRSFLNGAEQPAVTNAIMPAFTSQLDRLVLTSPTMATIFSVRDIHGIHFPGAPLPANMASLVSAYHANPMTKLSAWAQ